MWVSYGLSRVFEYTTGSRPIRRLLRFALHGKCGAIISVAFLLSACKSEKPELRILDVRLIDDSTGARPERGALVVEHPKPGPCEIIVREMPIGHLDRESYHVRLSWIQSHPVPQTVRISVDGYEPVELGMNAILRIDDDRIVPARLERIVNLTPK